MSGRGQDNCIKSIFLPNTQMTQRRCQPPGVFKILGILGGGVQYGRAAALPLQFLDVMQCGSDKEQR